MSTTFKKTALLLAMTVFYFPAPALAQSLGTGSNQPTIIMPSWNRQYIKATNNLNDLIKPEKIDFYEQREANQEAQSKIILVPIAREKQESEQYDPHADSFEQSDDSEPKLSEEASEESPSTSEGDEIADKGELSEHSIEDGNLSEVIYSETEGGHSSDLKLPEFDKLASGKTTDNPEGHDEALPASDPEEEEIVFAEEEDSENALEEVADVETTTATTFDEVSTTVKVKIVLQDISGDASGVDVALASGGTDVLSFGSGTVTFKPSETTVGKGTIVAEFASTENLSHSDLNTLKIKGSCTGTLVSYAIDISKKIKPEDLSLAKSESESDLALSFFTDMPIMRRATSTAATTSVTISHVLQFSDDDSYASGHLDTAAYKDDMVALDFGLGSESFKESSTMAGKGTLSFSFDSTSNLDFGDFNEIILKSDGSVSAEIVSNVVAIEKKVKFSDESTVIDDSATLELSVF